MEQTGKQVQRLSKITTVFYAIVSFISAAVSIYCFVISNQLVGLTGKAADYVGSIDGGGPGDGFLLIGGLAGTFLGGLAAVGVFIAGIFLAILFFNYAIPAIVGTVANHKYKNGLDVHSFKADAIVKIVFSVLPDLVLVWLLLEEFSIGLALVVLVFVLMFVCTIRELTLIHKCY